MKDLGEGQLIRKQNMLCSLLFNEIAYCTLDLRANENSMPTFPQISFSLPISR